MTTTDDLLREIFGNQRPALYHDFETWLRDSRRFKAFAIDYKTKIRAKLRNVRDEGGLKDLRAELETAALLLSSARFTIEYEKYLAAKQRGPDFTVTYKTHLLFNVEVRRIRNRELEDAAEEGHVIKLIQVLCDKLGQMPPGIVNLLWLIAERELSEADLNNATTILRQLAERKAEEFFARYGFKNASDFIKHYAQLSGMVLHQSDKNIVWLNPLARHKLLPEIASIIQRLNRDQER